MSNRLRVGTALLTLAICGGLATAASHEQAGAFTPTTMERERTLRLNAAPERVFPLFGPEGPLYGNAEFLFPGSTETHSGAVFRKVFHGVSTWWVVAEHAPRSRRIRYVYHEPGELMVQEIHCAVDPDNDRGTVATVVFRITSLSEDMNAPVQRAFPRYFDRLMEEWESEISRAIGEGS